MTGLMMQVTEQVNAEVFGIWFLIGAALVFFMQAGFAMVETGFTRAKNAGNIIMKNLMDFCIGTVVFAVLGFGLMFGEDIGGFIGIPTFDLFTDYGAFDWPNFVFNLVFCATAATIVSGAMAERTKFLSYCIYSAIISLVVYPVEAHWIWGSGWLAQMGFHDFAGSCAIHLVGGVTALIGAAIVGPRIGKFTKDKKPVAIPGHSLTLGALGCFILWFGWYGFNGAAATTGPQLGSIFLTTTIAPAVATVVCMIFTWLKYGKPDVSMCLNASLAGLVGITAGCDVMDAAGAAIVGIVSGLLVIFGVWLLDNVLKVDDPVGAVAVHFLNGIWGTLAVGLFATSTAPESGLTGLFYGGGFELFGKQLLGVLTVAAWTAVTMTLVFLVIKKTVGLRVSRHEEVVGLDLTEHGLASSYADFIPSTHIETTSSGKEREVANVIPAVPIEKAVPVEYNNTDGALSGNVHTAGVKMTKVDIITGMERFEPLKNALYDIGITGMTVTNTMGCGMQKGSAEYYRGVKVTPRLLPKVKIEVVVCKIPVSEVVDAAKNALYTGNIGDGKIFVYNVENVVKIRTSEEGYDALQDNA
ncbi:MAG: ammonium transporter [Oscillospiraceae bacterium]|nr:ammonium transporter [Oscillospiraceae bacterium]